MKQFLFQYSTAGGKSQLRFFVAKRARLRREELKSKKKDRFTGDPFLFFAKTPSENRRFPIPGAAESDLVRVL